MSTAALNQTPQVSVKVAELVGIYGQTVAARKLKISEIDVAQYVESGLAPESIETLAAAKVAAAPA